jgi:hypothetical protein
MIIKEKLDELESWDWWKNSQGKRIEYPDEKWEKWSNPFNKDIRDRIKGVKDYELEASEYVVAYTRGLIAVFRMWQLQYKIAYQIKTGKFVRQKKLKEAMEEYKTVRENALKFDAFCEEFKTRIPEPITNTDISEDSNEA